MDAIKKTMLRLKTWLEYILTHSAYFSYKTDSTRLFFPGCSLANGDPQLVMEIFKHLRKQDPKIGIWLDCCGRPLSMYNVKKTKRKNSLFYSEIMAKGTISEIITACGNCQVQFESLNNSPSKVKITSLYEVIRARNVSTVVQEYVLHHPCPSRNDIKIRQSAENFISRLSLKVENPSNAHPLACCLANNASAREKKRRLKDKHILTYCGHCVKSFRKDLKITHVLQLMFNTGNSFHKTIFVRNLFRYKKLKGMIMHMLKN